MDRWTKLYQIIPNINPQLQKNKTDIVLVHQARGNSFCKLTVIVLWMPCCLSGKHPEEEWGLIDWGCFLLCKPQSPAPTESGCAADICSKRSNCGDFKNKCTQRHIWSTALSSRLDLRQGRCNHDQREPAHYPPVWHKVKWITIPKE